MRILFFESDNLYIFISYKKLFTIYIVAITGYYLDNIFSETEYSSSGPVIFSEYVNIYFVYIKVLFFLHHLDIFS